MREVKYRAWDKINKEMLKIVTIYIDHRYIRGIIEVDDSLDLESSYNFEDIILMQWTGLKDINGVDIYEGDMVEYEDNVDGYWAEYEASEIVFDKDYLQFCFEYDASNFLSNYKNLKVVGNIYEK